MRLGLRARAVVAAAILACGAAGPAGAERPSIIPLLPPPPSVGGAEFPNFVRVRVGSDGTVTKVLFDTGSIGLRIRREMLGEDVEITDERISYVYAGDGTKLLGRLGYATVSFPGSDGVATKGRVAIQVVDQVTCDRLKPDCPGWKNGQIGVMGVGYYGRRVEEVYSPLDQLPGRLSDGFVVDTISDHPHLLLGPVASSRYAYAKMRRARNSPPGAAMWDTWSVEVCFRIGRGEKACGPTIFDTGAAAARFWPPGGAKVNRDGTLAAGRTVSMEADGIFRLAVLSGGKPWNNAFLIERRVRGQFGSNAGGQIFRRFIVAFDFVRGRIGFCRPKEGGLSAKVDVAKPCR